ncbi:MAG: sulfurtransferase [Candidatus Competibacteraceae bacterium]
MIAYGGEGNGRAGRLLWTLAALGHERASLLDGGIHACAPPAGCWKPSSASRRAARIVACFLNPAAVAQKDYILARLGQPDLVPLDARTLAEYAGLDRRAARGGGHIPGAVNLNWTDAMDPQRHLRFQPDLGASGHARSARRHSRPGSHRLLPDPHRSAHTYRVLRHLGDPRVRRVTPAPGRSGATILDLPVEV